MRSEFISTTRIQFINKINDNISQPLSYINCHIVYGKLDNCKYLNVYFIEGRSLERH